MNILVTGANGFIGRRIVNRLVRKGHFVFSSGRGPKPADSHNYRQANISNKFDCISAVKNIDSVIHCAGKAGAWGSRSEFIEANVVGTRNLLEASKANQVKKFINISSPSIYFDYKDQFNLKESEIPRFFSNAYAETKYQSECEVIAANSNKFNTISLRPRGVIGMGDRNWLPRIIEMKKKGSLIQPGDGSNIVDFTSVENLVDAIELCLIAPSESYGTTYNITNGSPEKLWGVIERTLTNIGLDSSRKRIPLFLAMAAARLSETYHSLKKTKNEPNLLPIKVGVAAYSMTLDISKAKKTLNYKPRVSTNEAIAEFVEWWSKI